MKAVYRKSWPQNCDNRQRTERTNENCSQPNENENINLSAECDTWLGRGTL